MITLTSGDWQAELLPELGGAISTLRHRGTDVLRPTPQDASHPLQTACFPLAPYCNRIRNGRFHFGTRDVELLPNHPPELHSLHGLSWQRPWRVKSRAEHECLLTDAYDGADLWPWAYDVQQIIELSPEGCAITLVLTNRSNEPMPAGLGLHPYFRRSAASELRFHADHVLLSDDDLLPTGIGAPADHFADWNNRAPLPTQTVDQCFVEWSGTAAIHDELGTIRMEADGAPHLHLYAPADRSALCLEPVSHTPDAPNRAPAEMIVLPRGCSASLTMRISAEPA